LEVVLGGKIMLKLRKKGMILNMANINFGFVIEATLPV
jgi:hypothetical protein